MLKVMRAFLIFSAIAGAGCSDGTSVNCTPVLVSAFRLDVRDSITGVSIASNSRVIVTQVGARTDTLSMSATAPDTSAYYVGDAAGTYSVTVSKPGYATWSRSGISVPGDGCHPTGNVVVTALLQPVR